MSQSPIYRVTETGEIGQLIPCPCDDPIILEFKDGIRDAFFLRELEPVPISSRTHGKSCEARIPLCGTGSTHPITESYSTRRRNAKNRGKGRPKGMARGTIEKMLAIYRFLETQSEAVYRSAIEKAVSFQLYTVSDVSTVAKDAGHAGKLRDRGADSGGTDVGRLAAHGTWAD